ncbi:tail fiber domain-containing protein [Sulfurovum sp. CS9]|uniref:tail fiber domain-containing protein n=1 Tax=Sulfurovum sp. CS9 TaxID=3391146 RepID=UPI0039EAF511
MNRIHVSALTSIILASAAMVSQVNAEETFESPVNIVPQTGSSHAGIFYDDTWLTAGSSTLNEFLIMNNDNQQVSFLVSSSGNVRLANSVFINRGQQMGIGIATPEDALHIGGTGNLILEKEGVASKWKIGTRADGGVLLRDMLSGNDPFSIDANAPTDSLNIADNGNIGLGTSTPSTKLDVRGDIASTWAGSNTVGDGLTNLLVLSASNSEVDKSSDVGFRLVNGSTSKGWNFRTNSGGDSFQATLQGTGGAEFTVTNATSDISGTELYLGNGAKNVGGVWINASSRALKENIKELSAQDALAAFHKLQPVTYNYKSDKKEQVVGFIAEDVPELVSINSRDGLSSMDMVAVLTKVVQDQDKSLAETKSELKKAQEKIAKLETMQKRLAKVESLLTNLALDTSNSKTEEVAFNTK